MLHLYIKTERFLERGVSTREEKASAGEKTSTVIDKDDKDVVMREDLKALFQRFGTVKVFLKAPNGLRIFGSSPDWIEFGWVEGLTLTGGGTFDGQGASSWPLNNCSTNKNCKLLPSNVKFLSMTKMRLRGIMSTNSKFFHIVLLDCKDFHGTGIEISAPANNPNTDGIHIESGSHHAVVTTATVEVIVPRFMERINMEAL
ncbi:hypothetical protein IFM89_026572 [Coptis chinensis]|uniref:Uncharacterized protein n=1 Tax=Coptis chinensis TaxID=261450 RepID=A0A835H127_9MAGN|nr:hypothetical protein IFM89_026572 [Coptis chinensis]